MYVEHLSANSTTIPWTNTKDSSIAQPNATGNALTKIIKYLGIPIQMPDTVNAPFFLFPCFSHPISRHLHRQLVVVAIVTGQKL